jgi:hypothetical protein
MATKSNQLRVRKVSPDWWKTRVRNGASEPVPATQQEIDKEAQKIYDFLYKRVPALIVKKVAYRLAHKYFLQIKGE